MLLLDDKTAEGKLDRTRARKLLIQYNGVSPHLRGLFWQLAAGAKSRSDRQEIRYGDLCRGLPPEEESEHLQQIDKDLGRTFPNNRAFTKEEGVAALRRVLLVYRYTKKILCVCMLCVCVSE
jgi:Rab-GTPase-TBC domain